MTMKKKKAPDWTLTASYYSKKVKVLDNGFVEYVSHMGDDLTVVNAARVSFAKESEWQLEEDKEIPPYGKHGSVAITPMRRNLSVKDKKLIDYLANHNHWTPFAHPQITFRVKAPIFIRTQLFKHKVGIVENEVSRRYVTQEPEFYLPFWRKAPTDGAKQGSSGFICEDSAFGDECSNLDKDYSNFVNKALEFYKDLLSLGVAPEQARGVLPQSTYTEWWWTGSLSAFARVCKLRTEEGAQWEVRQYGSAFSEILKDLYPYCWSKLT